MKNKKQEIIDIICRTHLTPNEQADLVLGLFSVRSSLIAFHKWQQKMWTNPNTEITENVVDVFLKSNL